MNNNSDGKKIYYSSKGAYYVKRTGWSRQRIYIETNEQQRNRKIIIPRKIPNAYYEAAAVFPIAIINREYRCNRCALTYKEKFNFCSQCGSDITDDITISEDAMKAFDIIWEAREVCLKQDEHKLHCRCFGGGGTARQPRGIKQAARNHGALNGNPKNG